MNCEKARAILMHMLCLTERDAIWGRIILFLASCAFVMRKAVTILS